MTPEIFAFVVMPGLAIAVAAVGYIVVVVTDPSRQGSPPVNPIPGVRRN